MPSHSRSPRPRSTGSARPRGGWWWTLLLTGAVSLLVRPGYASSLDEGDGQLEHRLLATSVSQRLNSDAHLASRDLLVLEREGVVTLSGTVPAVAHVARAGRVAALVPGVRAVLNRIVVAPPALSDSHVAAEVTRRIRRTAALASLPIAVSVDRGVVELSGKITSFEEQQLAERVASSVPGARFCNNLLSLASRIARTAAHIRGDILSRFDWDPLLHPVAASLKVVVSSTAVRLRGVVSSVPERNRAIALAWVRTVTSVDSSHLRVKEPVPPPAGGPTDSEIEQTIEAVAGEWWSVDLSKVTVSVLAGRVMLRGEVPSLAARDALVGSARSVVGVKGVDAELRGPWWRPPPPAPRSIPNVQRTTRRSSRR